MEIVKSRKPTLGEVIAWSFGELPEREAEDVSEALVQESGINCLQHILEQGLRGDISPLQFLSMLQGNIETAISNRNERLRDERECMDDGGDAA